MVGVYGETNMHHDSRPLNKSDITPDVVLYYLDDFLKTKNTHKPGTLANYILGAKKAPTYITLHVGKLLNELAREDFVSKTHKNRSVYLYQITPKGEQHLHNLLQSESPTDSAQHHVSNVAQAVLTEPTKIGVLETVNKLIEEGITIRNLDYLTKKVCEIEDGNAPESMKDEVYNIVQYLEEQGCMSITRKNINVGGNTIYRKVYEITDDGKDYLESPGSESQDIVEVLPDIITDTSQEDGRNKVEDGSPISVYGVKYNWDDLRAEILKEFGGEYHLTALDSTKGFPGAVHVRLDSDVFCVGYLDEDNNLVPGPEAMHVFFISENAGKGKKQGRRALNSFFKGLDDSSGASGSLSNLMSNNVGEVAGLLHNNMYRDAGKLTTNKGNLSDRGKLFFDAVIELFGKDKFCEVDSMGKDHKTQYGTWFDINEYMPKNSVVSAGEESGNDTSEMLKYGPGGERIKKGRKKRHNIKNRENTAPNKR